MTMNSLGWGQAFCLSVGPDMIGVGIKSTSAIVLCFLLRRGTCSGGFVQPGWLFSATTGGCSELPPLSCLSADRSKLYWLEVGEPSSLNRNWGSITLKALSFLT